jgi:hypothetical protein
VVTRATLRRELERLKRDSGWYEAVEAEIEAARQRQRTRFHVVEYEARTNKLVDGFESLDQQEIEDSDLSRQFVQDFGRACEFQRAQYERTHKWLEEEDTAEQWRADHDLLVAHEIEQYGEERDVPRRDGWGGNRIEMGQHFFDIWERFIHVEHLDEKRREKLHALWLEAADGRGVLTEKSWQEKHRARLDNELPPLDPFSRKPVPDSWREDALRYGWM